MTKTFVLSRFSGGRAKVVIAAAVFAVVGLVLWFPVFHFQFLSDDWDLIYHANRYGSFLDRLTQNDHQTNQGYSYRPLVGISLTFLKSIFKMNPAGYHAFFAALHLVNAVLVMMVAERLADPRESEGGGGRALGAPFVCGFLFLILPSHVEAVAWIAAGGDVAATSLYLLALLSFLRFFSERHFPAVGSPETQAGTRRPCGFSLCAGSSSKRGTVSFFLSMVFFLLGLLTKEIVVTLPIVLVVLMFWRLGRKRNDATERDRISLRHFSPAILKTVIPFFMIIGVYALFRYHATGILAGYYGRPSVGIDLLQGIRMGSDVLSSFLSWGSFRIRMADVFAHNIHWLLALFALVVSYVQKFHREQLASILLFLSVFLLSLAPVLPLGMNPLSDEGERYGYLPSVFFVMFAVSLTRVLFTRHARVNENQEKTVQKKRRALSSLCARFPVFAGMTALVIYLCLGLHQKLSLWQRYQDSNYRILNQIYRLNSVNDGRTLVVVGLPDSYGGVQGFRNGIEEAYRLYYGEDLEMVRVPVYVIDGGRVDSVFKMVADPPPATPYSIADGFDSAIPNQLFLKTKDKSLRLTGEKEYADKYVEVRFFRWHYDIGRADGVTILFRDDFVQGMKKGLVRLVWYDGERIVDALVLS